MQRTRRASQRQLFERRMRTLNRLVLGGVAVFVPIYLGAILTGGSADKLGELPDLFERIKNPIVWEVPEGGVRYEHFFRGPAQEGHKFALIQVRMQARMKIGFAIVPRSFRLVDEENARYYPLSRSPLFIAYGDEFRMDRDDIVEGELLFEIPVDRQATNLLFDRYQEE